MSDFDAAPRGLSNHAADLDALRAAATMLDGFHTLADWARFVGVMRAQLPAIIAELERGRATGPAGS